jgi:hypothetical protein
MKTKEINKLIQCQTTPYANLDPKTHRQYQEETTTYEL